MYLKSTHSQLLDGGHQWDVTLFCNAEANSIASVSINPKSKGSKVVANDAKPAPTAYTMSYTCSKNDLPPVKFSAIITFLKTNEKKTVSVPANMATDRKRRRADGSTDHDESNDNHNQVNNEQPLPLPLSEKEGKEKRRKLYLCFGRSKPIVSEKDEVPKGSCCCIIM
ncbi:11990_t:CDS:1 [Entrophospora sp. SA101]|nr:11177_t:CDS:1 [Entrophospora sp. SA101]CAJ0644015.1 2626_t:CDS:1 [Entrophospora sp. SA101]CAJ0763749.1 3319_t:CDS:1 [Entrophospora sp. SA101]CAJ0764198.1 11990_t:CDS:1 [Entrophospora sp. SA101]CAJ0859040.1 12842_t:CDS:1 [Entrophospora sp. SA101]